MLHCSLCNTLQHTATYCNTLQHTATLAGNRWKENSLFTALVYPGFVFAIFFSINLVIWGQKSSGAVPFGVAVCWSVLQCVGVCWSVLVVCCCRVCCCRVLLRSVSVPFGLQHREISSHMHSSARRVRVAACCSVLQRVAACCSVSESRRAAERVCCSALQCVAVCCSVL